LFYITTTDSLPWTRNALYPQRLALTSPTSGRCSVGIVRLWTKATEFSFSTTTGKLDVTLGGMRI
jgi:hypothetical protein